MRLSEKENLRAVLSDPEIMHGTLVFLGTRVPVKNLFDYLEAGESLADFLDDFPGVTRKQAVSVLHEAAEVLAKGATSP